ncbi:MAG: PIN domain-containing protein [Dehalococcoidia bacterium]|nr:PIN domain-containing protein [Dehalococcoidia bacterium]
MTPSVAYLDTNVLIRFLVRDNAAQWSAAEALLNLPRSRRPRLVLTIATLSEIVFVLSKSVYRYSRSEVADAVEGLLSLPIEVMDADIVAHAVGIFRNRHPEWDDALLAAYALARADGGIYTFDKQLQRLEGLNPLPFPEPEP